MTMLFRIHVDEQIKGLRFPGFIDAIEAKQKKNEYEIPGHLTFKEIGCMFKM